MKNNRITFYTWICYWRVIWYKDFDNVIGCPCSPRLIYFPPSLTNVYIISIYIKITLLFWDIKYGELKCSPHFMYSQIFIFLIAF